MDIRARVIELNEVRARVWEEGKRLLEDTTGREMSAEERQTWDRINARIEDIDASCDKSLQSLDNFTRNRNRIKREVGCTCMTAAPFDGDCHRVT